VGTTNELIQRLHEEKLNLVEQLRGLVADVEAGGGTWAGEDELKSQAINTEIDTRTKRISYLLELQKTNHEMDEQRAQFEKIVRPDGIAGEANSDDERMRAFVKAAAPDSDTWAPKAIEFKIPQAVKDREHARRMGVEYRDLSKLSAAAGADVVPVGFVAKLYEHLVEMGAVRQTGATILTTSSGEDLKVPKTTGHGTATLVAEAGALLENDPAFAQITLNAYKYGQLIEVSNELVADSAIDLLGYIARAAGIAVGTATGTAYVTGTGTAQPQGVANAPTAGKTGATGQTLTVLGEDLIDLYHSVISGYRTRGVWLMNDLSAAIVRKLREGSGATAGNFLWQPGLQAGQPDMLLGKPVVTDPNMAAMAANAYSIAFGDFSMYYTIRDVDSVRFERSDDFRFGNDLVAFRIILRTDGKQVVNGASGAVKFYRNSAT
jgi:HK97 family phage major capsid protein